MNVLFGLHLFLVKHNLNIFHICTLFLVQISQQVRTQASNHVVDTLSHLAQRFANHFMPKSVRSGGSDANKIEQPPNLSIFWNILRRCYVFFHFDTIICYL